MPDVLNGQSGGQRLQGCVLGLCHSQSAVHAILACQQAPATSHSVALLCLA